MQWHTVADGFGGSVVATTVRDGCSIAVRNVHKTYRSSSLDPVPALAGVSFDVEAREFVSIVGASGCGKSTMLRIIGGLDSATDSGEVFIDGSGVNGPRRDVGIVFQDATLLPWRNVLQNAMIGIEILGMDEKAYRARAMDLIHLVRLDGFEHRYPYELSGGMQQRAALVRALLHQPKLLLLDEPFGALDALTREAMGLELLRVWQANRTSIVFVTHSVLEALFLSDRVVVFSARPGHVLDIVTVGLPRPRRLDMLGSPEVGAMANHIRGLLGAQVVS
jgi:NitT/TauT family transport system ATP-binding protein